MYRNRKTQIPRERGEDLAVEKSEGDKLMEYHRFVKKLYATWEEVADIRTSLRHREG